MNDLEIKEQVRQFYDQVGWQMMGDDLYQNARYEDLRPVSSEYIHRCHLRVKKFLKPSGLYLLDAGSGPIQYPDYLVYSQGYQFRVCLDISIVALKEARKRIGGHGLYVAADVANLPFQPGVFEGAVSLHTLHHLPLSEQKAAYRELIRILAPGSSVVLVNGWTESVLMNRLNWMVRLMERITSKFSTSRATSSELIKETKPKTGEPTGTYIHKQDAAWLRQQIQDINNSAGQGITIEIRCWRSVNVRFLRAVIHPALGGRLKLKLIFWLEERFPHFFGEKGQYPLVIIHTLTPPTPKRDGGERAGGTQSGGFRKGSRV